MVNYTQNDVICFAKDELEKYLNLINLTADIKLGLFDDFNIESDTEDPFWDDAYKISIKDGCGYAAGSNGRSVLFAVYRILEEWGIGWLRPGKDGTYIPENGEYKDIEIDEKADYRHRTMCIEGAITIENALDMIEWIPKVSFNSYYIQFNDAFIFFDRYYGHRKNPFKEPEHFDYDMALLNVDKMITEIKKRGLLLQRMGHGWTCDPFGIENHGWDPVDPDTIPQSYKDICAEVNGVRGLWKDIPMAGQLCYSNPVVSETMTNGVIKYIEEHPETDIIHFWLGDYFNNTCECPECTKLHYSDYYIRMVNMLTKKLKEQGINKKIAICCGYNKVWPPKDTEIAYPEMVLLTIAPISRTFGMAFPDEFKIKELPPYALNAFSLPRSVDENLTPLYNWKKIYSGDIVDFDYHLMWDHVLDAGGEGIAKTIHTDIKNLKKLGLNGFISCQLQRNACPSAIAMTIMGKTLWNRNTDFSDTKTALYKNTFGSDYEVLIPYFETLSSAFDIGHIRSQVPTDRNDFILRMQHAVEMLCEYEDIIKAHLDTKNAAQRSSWKFLDAHRKIYGILGEGILAHLNGDAEKAQELYKKSVEVSWSLEDELQPVLDSFFYDEGVPFRVNLDKEAKFVDF